MNRWESVGKTELFSERDEWLRVKGDSNFGS
jgi:hypothetical protein